MPLTQNLNVFFGAAVLGVISAATLYCIEKGRRRYAMAQDLARLDEELTKVKADLQKLLKNQAQEQHQHNSVKKTRRSRPGTALSMASNSSAGDGYLSAATFESSDSEFYDISDDDDTITDNSGSITSNSAPDLLDLDKYLDNGSESDLNTTLIKLEQYAAMDPSNLDCMWRVAKAHYKISELTEDTNEKKKHLTEGIVACDRGLLLDSDNANLHKWYAILVGSRSNFLPVPDKIKDGFVFQKHVETAIGLNPEDGSLYHLLGRFFYETAGLSWIERKIATSLFAEPPKGTYEDALKNFMLAEERSTTDWKENKLMIAKCKIELQLYEEACVWLVKAANCKHGDGLDDKFDSEIKSLMDKYKKYR